jgi:hypothetical protein
MAERAGAGWSRSGYRAPGPRRRHRPGTNASIGATAGPRSRRQSCPRASQASASAPADRTSPDLGAVSPGQRNNSACAPAIRSSIACSRSRNPSRTAKRRSRTRSSMTASRSRARSSRPARSGATSRRATSPTRSTSASSSAIPCALHLLRFKQSGLHGEPCRVEIGDGFNVSFLEHFARYTGGRGERDASCGRADIATAQIDAVERPRLVGDQAPRSRAGRSSPGTL